MDQEISSGAMLGLCLITLAAIIGLGFGTFQIAKAVTNDGVTQITDNLAEVTAAEMSDYDQKVVTGTQVMSTFKQFKGKNVAILIMTKGNKDKAVSGESALGTGNGVTNAYGTATKFKQNLARASLGTKRADGTITYLGAGLGIRDSKNVVVKYPYFVNYNALIDSDPTGFSVFQHTSGRFVYFDKTCWRTVTGLAAKNGKVQFNNILVNLSKSGMMEYVTTNARYEAFLIRDPGDNILGVAFEQICKY